MPAAAACPTPATPPAGGPAPAPAAGATPARAAAKASLTARARARVQACPRCDSASPPADVLTCCVALHTSCTPHQSRVSHARAPKGRSRAQPWARTGVAARPPAHGVCTSRGGGGVSDIRTLPEYPRDPHAMQADAQLQGRPHSVLRAHVVFDCAAAWTRLGVRVPRGRAPRRRRRGWLACAARGGGNFN